MTATFQTQNSENTGIDTSKLKLNSFWLHHPNNCEYLAFAKIAGMGCI